MTCRCSKGGGTRDNESESVEHRVRRSIYVIGEKVTVVKGQGYEWNRGKEEANDVSFGVSGSH